MIRPFTAGRCPARRWRRLASALMLAGALLGALPGAPRAEPNPAERKKIAEQALESFKQMVNLWREELYFDLYDFGMEATKTRISREEFAQRMVRLSWVPEGELNPRFLKTDFRFRTMVYVRVRILYRNKFKPTETFSKDQTVLLLFEGKTWRIDLIQLVRSPYS